MVTVFKSRNCLLLYRSITQQSSSLPKKFYLCRHRKQFKHIEYIKYRELGGIELRRFR